MHLDPLCRLLGNLTGEVMHRLPTGPKREDTEYRYHHRKGSKGQEKQKDAYRDSAANRHVFVCSFSTV